VRGFAWVLASFAAWTAPAFADPAAPEPEMLTHKGQFGLSARTALGLGFQGKMCVHPDQIAVVNGVFTPSEAEVAFAERVAAAFERAEADGIASIQLDGKFIDYPIVYRAQRMLQQIAAIRARQR